MARKFWHILKWGFKTMNLQCAKIYEPWLVNFWHIVKWGLKKYEFTMP
jgi:hypothetical protein